MLGLNLMILVEPVLALVISLASYMKEILK